MFASNSCLLLLLLLGSTLRCLRIPVLLQAGEVVGTLDLGILLTRDNRTVDDVLEEEAGVVVDQTHPGCNRSCLLLLLTSNAADLGDDDVRVPGTLLLLLPKSAVAAVVDRTQRMRGSSKSRGDRHRNRNTHSTVLLLLVGTMNSGDEAVHQKLIAVERK